MRQLRGGHVGRRREAERGRHRAVEHACVVLVWQRHERRRRPAHHIQRHRLAAWPAVDLTLDVERLPLVLVVLHHHERHVRAAAGLGCDGSARGGSSLSGVLRHVACEVRLLRVRLATHATDVRL